MERHLKREELDTRANLERATAVLHDDVYNEVKHGRLNQLRRYKLEESKKTRGEAIRSRVKRKQWEMNIGLLLDFYL
jgi:hypothetical protein